MVLYKSFTYLLTYLLTYLFCPGHRWGAHDAPPDFLVGSAGEPPPHCPPPSASMMSCHRRLEMCKQ